MTTAEQLMDNPTTDEFPLNEDQQIANQAMQDFYYLPGAYFYLLEGHPGVGKTYTIQTTIKELMAANPTLKVCFSATTNKAVKVLRQMAEDNELNVHCATIHSILGLVLSNDGEERKTRKMVEGSFDEFDIVVVDEISMATKYLWSVMESHAYENHVKVILMGDKNQLPPVKEGEALAFSAVESRHKLTKSMRQAEGSPILDLIAELRSTIEFRTPFNIVTSTNDEGNGIHCVNAKTFAEWVDVNFNSDEYKNNPNSFRCLAWTNKRVNTMNKRLRKLLVGVTESPFIEGERVLARQPIIGLDEWTGQATKPIIKTDEECKVLKVTEMFHPAFDGTSEKFKVWAIDLLSDLGAYETAYVLHKDSEADYSEMINTLSKRAKNDHSQWRHFWGFKEMFADLQPPHAMTIHRSQGSTYDNVFIDLLDVYKQRKEKERNQLLYVGCSRARENLILMDRIQ